MTEPLPAGALSGVRVGISVSGSADLERLGLAEEHLRSALGELARAVTASGGGLAYGGHLDPGGYTAFLVSELSRHGHEARPLLVCLAWPEHRRLALSELRRRAGLGPIGDVVCLDPDGREVDPAAGRTEDAEPVTDPDLRRRALTGMRRYLNDRTHARVLIGGRRHGFQGELPGPLEEALLAVGGGTPVYPAAGFGGVTADIAHALGMGGGHPDDPAAPRLTAGLDRLRALAPEAPRNGLSDAENLTLATTRRPGEIAALVTLGLARLAGREG
ncbi:hypothetical protein DP939_12675 [Spongiactinospora rosea]|uniref:Uncharacterized protein n=1 Tax=Spongiactinospora rosea TaxID=2248750 RepID=A0A366M0N1_9ACTN|nr:hypothetical protein [Spongiactinospora rosea]RBQ19597.1 hypothetical protein DP939_12675 [Spongiactinospora rosea]